MKSHKAQNRVICLFRNFDGTIREKVILVIVLGLVSWFYNDTSTNIREKVVEANIIEIQDCFAEFSMVMEVNVDISMQQVRRIDIQ